MGQERPRVTICLPVYEAEASVGRALDSALAQDFSDLEIVVSDNGSRDATPRILREYAARDSRIRLFTNPENLGLIENVNRVFRLARGEFVRMLGADDWLEPSYLSRCLEAFAARPDAIAVTSAFRAHFDSGDSACLIHQGEVPDSPDPAQRIRVMMSLLDDSRLVYDPNYGLIRREALWGSGLIRMTAANDTMLSVELALMGPLVHVRECLSHRSMPAADPRGRDAFLRRLHPTRWRELDITPLGVGRALYSLVGKAGLTPAQEARCLPPVAWFTTKRIVRRRWRALRSLRRRLGITRESFGRLDHRLGPRADPGLDPDARADEARALRRGELVEVRSREEILATLDENGDLEGLPFMPEMLAFCGTRFRVQRRAHKTCDTISGPPLARRMERAVHLETRCDGKAHGGCQAACLLFWKEAWLKRVEPARHPLGWRLLARETQPAGEPGRSGGAGTLERLEAATRREALEDPSGPIYRCQATRLLDATRPLAWWEPRQYLLDWRSGNVLLGFMARSALLRILFFATLGRGFRLKRRLYDAVARLLGEPAWPYASGTSTGKTPDERLDLQPGDTVQIKPHEEVLASLRGRAHRGLSFAPEMVRYCGGTFRVKARVERIVNEKTGRMLKLANDCLILDDVVCQSECSSNRLFCPRAIHPYWRETWLRRVEAQAPPRESAAGVSGSADPRG